MCGYMNGTIGYWKEIAAQSERHFCPVKDQQGLQKFHKPAHHKNFVLFGDKQLYNTSNITRHMRGKD